MSIRRPTAAPKSPRAVESISERLQYVLQVGNLRNSQLKSTGVNGTKIEYWPDSTIVKYDGEWLDDKRHGQGSSYSDDGRLRYEGTWQMGKVNGQGTSYSEDGEMQYVGQFQDGKRHGNGKEYRQNSTLRYYGGAGQAVSTRLYSRVCG